MRLWDTKHVDIDFWHRKSRYGLQAGPINFLEVKEVDGSPDVTLVTVIRVPNGSLTNDGGGQVTLAAVAAGNNTEVQRNNAGLLGGISGFTSDGTNVTAGDGNLRATSPLITTGLDDANGNQIIGFTPTGSAVNAVNITNAATAGSPVIEAIGSDTNIELRIVSKGTGEIELRGGTNAQLNITGTAGTEVGTVLTGRTISAKTTNYNVVDGDSRTFFTNEGAGGTVNFTLPTAAARKEYTFYIQAAQTLTVTANTGDTIRLAGSVSASAGNVSANVVGNLVRLVCINATEWVAESIIGTWTVT
jgi:hypothetical protein